jgi:NADPH-dependent glutamate synthase beta subunit-like oxidoreductase
MTNPNEALRTILPIAGWGDGQAADVVFTGGADPVLPTPFRIGAAGAATLAASGLAATELWQVRTGRRQRVTVDLRQAAAALRSGHYLHTYDLHERQRCHRSTLRQSLVVRAIREGRQAAHAVDKALMGSTTLPR